MPADLALDIAAKLRVDGTVARGHLGLDVQEMTPALAQALALPRNSGALVVQVTAGGPAAAAGIMVGDVITAYDNVEVMHFTDLLRRVSFDSPGTQRSIGVWRFGAARLLHATLAQQRSAHAVLGPGPGPETMDGLGLGLSEMNGAQRVRLSETAGWQCVRPLGRRALPAFVPAIWSSRSTVHASSGSMISGRRYGVLATIGRPPCWSGATGGWPTSPCMRRLPRQF